MKNYPGYIILIHKCIINDNHKIYGFWDMEHNGQNFLSFGAIFCTFTPLMTQKIKILKEWERNKNPGDIMILHMCTINDHHMMYGEQISCESLINFPSQWKN